ncbi:MAG: phosphatidate cytidylyltransferase, partial [Clostridia bacterium]|nr:phosphatidate cytidylyltransferase [Clostridia bacterium]
VILAAYTAIMGNIMDSITVNVTSAICVGLICGVISQFGDLCASVIKRENNIKDFGKIMPGHGGVMDRFDSFIFVAPVVYYFLNSFPIFI